MVLSFYTIKTSDTRHIKLIKHFEPWNSMFKQLNENVYTKHALRNIWGYAGIHVITIFFMNELAFLQWSELVYRVPFIAISYIYSNKWPCLGNQ